MEWKLGDKVIISPCRDVKNLDYRKMGHDCKRCQKGEPHTIVTIKEIKEEDIVHYGFGIDGEKMCYAYGSKELKESRNGHAYILRKHAALNTSKRR